MTERFGVSAGTLSLLGLSRARNRELPTTAHFMVGERCTHSCAFCAQARDSKAPPHHLSRVTWPEKLWDEIETPLSGAIAGGLVKRVCIQTVETPGGTESALQLTRKVRSLSPDVQISICVAPESVSRVEAFFRAGASRVGLPVDAVTPETYRRVKGGDLERAWAVLEKASSLWPGRISTHFICGLGETEEEMVLALDRARTLGITVALFAFTPVKGTLMEHDAPPDVSSYRRVQIAAYFLKMGGSKDSFEFRDGKIVRISTDDPAFLGRLWEGKPFETSGCPDCNRPYYNERPGRRMMNFPRSLTEKEVRECIAESGLFRG
ncbi:MAG TPA: radical SAM protein [Firmicutes bacterium]|nr:radical SAM protein [Candidatus Fermentithermobacillaceae bacterium]